MTTTPTWPEERWPTAVELLEWFKRQTPEDQKIFMARVLRDIQVALACDTQWHEEELKYLRFYREEKMRELQDQPGSVIAARVLTGDNPSDKVTP